MCEAIKGPNNIMHIYNISNEWTEHQPISALETSFLKNVLLKNLDG